MTLKEPGQITSPSVARKSNLAGETINSHDRSHFPLCPGGRLTSLTYKGVVGVSENIKVSSSGVQGGGQLSVPGVVLVNFSGVERIDVNGNAPTPSEADTLTFAGTNAIDRFQINLAADRLHPRSCSCKTAHRDDDAAHTGQTTPTLTLTL